MDQVEDASLDNFNHLSHKPLAILFFVLYLFSAYGKDAGKFWLIKYTSAMRQKVLALLFPVGTWVIGLIIYYMGGNQHLPTLGVAWDSNSVATWVQLVCFVVIILANVIYVTLKKK